MADLASAAAGGLLAKLLPAGIGAGLMVLVDPPATKRELFVRLFAGLAMSFLLTGATIDGVRTIGWFSWLERGNLEHVVAVAGLWGALGWFVIGGLAMWGKKLRADPAAAIKELRP